MPSSKRSVSDLSVAVVPIAAVAAVPIALGYASDAPSALVFVAAPAAVLSAGLLALSRWRSRRADQQEPADGPLAPGTGWGQAWIPAGPVPGQAWPVRRSADPESPAPADPPPMHDVADEDRYGSDDVFGAPPQRTAPAPSPAPPVVASPGATAAPAPMPAPAPAPAAAVAAQPKARLMTVLAELSGCLSLVVSVIALFKDK